MQQIKGCCGCRSANSGGRCEAGGCRGCGGPTQKLFPEINCVGGRLGVHAASTPPFPTKKPPMPKHEGPFFRRPGETRREDFRIGAYQRPIVGQPRALAKTIVWR